MRESADQQAFPITSIFFMADIPTDPIIHHFSTQSFIYYGLTFVKGTFLFTVILLLGSGWSFFKPFLTPKERRVIYFVFILQIIDNIAVVVLTHETLGERLYSDWSAILHLVDIISCCAILIPIVWQVNSLEQSL